jgi:hypothetical protein
MHTPHPASLRASARVIRSRQSLPAALGLFVVTAGAAAGVAAAPGGAGAAPGQALVTIKPAKGFIDDAYALSPDGQVLFYVNTDGATWAKLLAVGLPPLPGAASPPAATPPAPGPAAKDDAKGGKPAGPAPAKSGASAAASTSLVVAPGETKELLSEVPLSATRLYLLPEDRVLIVSRDVEVGATVNGDVYSLRTRSKVAVPGGIGPASEITLGRIGSDPVVVQLTLPQPRKPDLKIAALHAATLRPLGQKTYDVGEDTSEVRTALGLGAPLYFLDDYLTWVVKHGGAYDKKKDFRQPDFLAFVDTLTGKVRASRPIGDPRPLLEVSKLRREHAAAPTPSRGASLVVVADEATHQIDLLRAVEATPPAKDGPTETRFALPLPREAVIYDPNTLRYQLARPGLLVASLSVDPVNERAVAQKRSDPDDLDLFAVELTGPSPGPPRKLLTLPGQKRPSSWAVTAGGRLVLLRKHKGFSRGGTEAEVFDLALPGAP